jgi:hypothetical protein
MTIDPMIYALACDRDGRSGAVKYTVRATEEELAVLMAALEMYVAKYPANLTACECLRFLSWCLDT